MDTRLLKRFVTLSEELHFGLAASRSNIAQSGLSQQIQQLEEQLRVQLVSRSKCHIALTRTGESQPHGAEVAQAIQHGRC
jgi:DNA-binding transcriptional LysR family regulator